jgi:hypothetical protein
MEPALAERAQQLKRWVIETFEENEDIVEIEYAIAKLVRGRPDPDGADDGHILRVLRHPDLPINYAHTILALLSRRHGAGGVGADTSVADQAFLGEMVRFLAHAEESPLQQCMMAYSALFPPGGLPRADLLLGGSQVAETLLRGSDHSKQKAARLVVRLHKLYEERELIAAVTEKIAERFVEVDDIQAFVGFHGQVSREALGSMAEVRGRLPGVTALDFGWVYRSIVADSDRRREEESRAQAEEMVRELGWGAGGSDGDAGSDAGSGTGRRSGGSGGRDDDDGAHGQAGATPPAAGKLPVPEGRPPAGTGRRSLPAVQHSGGARIEEGRTGPSEGGAADMDVDRKSHESKETDNADTKDFGQKCRALAHWVLDAFYDDEFATETTSAISKLIRQKHSNDGPFLLRVLRHKDVSPEYVLSIFHLYFGGARDDGQRDGEAGPALAKAVLQPPAYGRDDLCQYAPVYRQFYTPTPRCTGEIPWQDRVVFAVKPESPLSALPPHEILDIPVIYQITFAGYPHRYVGYTNGAAGRFETHILTARDCPGVTTPLAQFMRRVGIWNATMEILEICDVGELSQREEAWIQKVAETYPLLNVAGNKQQPKNKIKKTLLEQIAQVPVTSHKPESDCSILAPGGRRYYAVLYSLFREDRVGFIAEKYYVRPARIELGYEEYVESDDSE